MEPIPVGTLVVYKGSLTEYHGVTFAIVGTDTPRHSAEMYSDGVAYVLSDGFPPTLSNVRRASFTIADAEGANCG